MSGWKDACGHRNSALDVFGRLTCGDCSKVHTPKGWLESPPVDLGTFEMSAEQKRIHELTAERDALLKEQEAWRKFTRGADATVDKAEAERDALKADLDELGAERNRHQDAAHKLRVENERLRALVDKMQERPVITQLTELREAAEALEKRARTEAEFLQSEGYKRGMYLGHDCDEFKAILAKLTP